METEGDEGKKRFKSILLYHLNATFTYRHYSADLLFHPLSPTHLPLCLVIFCGNLSCTVLSTSVIQNITGGGNRVSSETAASHRKSLLSVNKQQWKKNLNKNQTG